MNLTGMSDTQPCMQETSQALKKKFSQTALAVFAFLFFVFAGSGISAFFLRAQETKVTHSQSVLLKSADLLSLIKDIEAGQRGYLLTGKVEYLEPYYVGLEKVQIVFSELQEMAVDNPEQRQRLAQIHEQIQSRIQIAKKMVEEKRVEVEGSDRPAYQLAEGKVLMDSLVKNINEFNQAEKQSFETRSSRFQWIFWGFLVSVMGALLACFGLLRHFYMTVNDQIDLQFQMKDQLRVSQEKLAMALAVGKMGPWEYHPRTQKMLPSRSCLDRLNFGVQDFNGTLTDFLSHFPGKEQLKLQESFYKALVDKFFPDTMIQLMDDFGQERWVQFKSVLVDESNGYEEPVFLGVVVDVTESIEKESLIRQQQMSLVHTSKMAALGEMAGGIAHEINNPLAVISTKAQLLRGFLEKGNLNTELFLQGLNKIDQTIMRIAKIIRSLRSFSRESDQDPMESAHLDLIVAEALDLCQEKLKNYGIDMRIKDVPSLLIECRSTQISQILMNLVTNAFDAIEPLEDKWIEISAKVKGERVQIFVTDSGGGIPPEIAEKILDPFFTTKEVGKGTGLGLSISKGLAESHGGSLSYDPTSSHTRFVLDLPIVAKAQARKAA